jgi:hypothetical protein
MNYSLMCPVSGCGVNMTLEGASSPEYAKEQMFFKLREHVMMHPDLTMSEDEMKAMVNEKMVQVG